MLFKSLIMRNLILFIAGVLFATLLRGQTKTSALGLQYAALTPNFGQRASLYFDWGATATVRPFAAVNYTRVNFSAAVQRDVLFTNEYLGLGIGVRKALFSTKRITYHAGVLFNFVFAEKSFWKNTTSLKGSEYPPESSFDLDLMLGAEYALKPNKLYLGLEATAYIFLANQPFVGLAAGVRYEL